MRKYFILPIILGILLLPAIAQAQTYCLNSTWSRTVLAVSNEGINIDEYCPGGCNPDKGECININTVNSQQATIGLVLFIFLFILGLACLIIGYEKSLIHITILSIGIMFALTLQAFTFDKILSDTSFSSLTYILVMLCLVIGIIGIVMVIGRSMELAREEAERAVKRFK